MVGIDILIFKLNCMDILYILTEGGYSCVVFFVVEKENLLVPNAFKCLMEICMENMVSVVTAMFLGIFGRPEMVFKPKDLVYNQYLVHFLCKELIINRYFIFK